jgi:hypothetical protein
MFKTRPLNSGAKPNNSFQPTGNSLPFIRQLGCLVRFFPAAEFGRSAAVPSYKFYFKFEDRIGPLSSSKDER